MEDRVLDGLWGDGAVGRRSFDVEEQADGTVALSGIVHSEEERRRALMVAGRARDVRGVEDRLVVQKRAPRRFLAARRS